MSKPRPWPWFPFYVEDWLTSPTVLAMSLAAQGAYVRLLCHQWRDGRVPTDETQLRRVLGCNVKVLAEVLGSFPKRNSRSRVNRRLEEHRATQVTEREKRKRDGAKGGSSSAQARLKRTSSNGDGDGDGDGDLKRSRFQEPCHCNGDGAIRDATGKILRTCKGCPAGRDRALRFAREKELEETSAARKAADLPRDPAPARKHFDAPAGPSAIGDLLPDQEESA